MQEKQLYAISGDIISMLTLAEKVGWRSLTELTLKRIMYIASVLYCFTHDDENIFISDYNFVITNFGPDCSVMNNAIVFLCKDLYVTKDAENRGYILGSSKAPNYLVTTADTIRYKWLETIIYILSTYGEDRIYDFIFRDPEYRKSFDSNSKQIIDLDSSNSTLQVLNEFRSEFEKKTHANRINDQNAYVKLYFEFIFANVIRRQ